MYRFYLNKNVGIDNLQKNAELFAFEIYFKQDFKEKYTRNSFLWKNLKITLLNLKLS